MDIEALKQELSALVGTAAFAEKVSALNLTPGIKKELTEWLNKELKTAENEIKDIKTELAVREQLSEVSKFINLSYISRTYFNRSRQWLTQRINGNVVSGKPRYLNEKEKIILNNALQDMSKKIGSIAIF